MTGRSILLHRRYPSGHGARVVLLRGATAAPAPRWTGDRWTPGGRQSTSGRQRRRCFRSVWRRFATSRRLAAALDGRVARRRVGRTRAAATRASSRRRASSRLRRCERLAAHTTRTRGPSASRSRRRVGSSRLGLAAMSKTTSTRVLAVLACWPPGPPAPLKRHCSSSSGTTPEVCPPGDRASRDTPTCSGPTTDSSPVDPSRRSTTLGVGSPRPGEATPSDQSANR